MVAAGTADIDRNDEITSLSPYVYDSILYCAIRLIRLTTRTSVWMHVSITLIYKNSSGDEIANVNFLRRYGTYVLQNTKKREPTSFNQLDDS